MAMGKALQRILPLIYRMVMTMADLDPKDFIPSDAQLEKLYNKNQGDTLTDKDIIDYVVDDVNKHLKRLHNKFKR